MKRLFIGFCFLVASTTLFAQTGTISGTIKDAATGEAVIGAGVLVDGSSQGAATDLDGNFVINRVPTGSVSVTISYVSYITKKIEGVFVQEGATTQISTTLDEDIEQLNEVVIVGTRETTTEVSVILEMKNASQVVSGISAEQIARSLDRDAAEVVRRIPGVTIAQDRFIVIRGLNQRYNNVLLHGVFAPSVESDIKAFSFDLIPSNMIDQILIYKSPSPDLPGEFAGGIIKINTRSIPDRNQLTFNVQTFIREGSSFETFRGQERDGLHWTGFNTGRYSLPENFPNESEVKRSVGTPRGQEIGRSLFNEWEPTEYNAGIDHKYQLTNNARFNWRNINIGNITSLNYSNSKTVFEIKRDEYEGDGTSLRRTLDFNDVQNTQNIRVGLLHNWAFRFSPYHTIEFKNLFNQLGTYQHVSRTGFDDLRNYFADNFFFSQSFRGIYSGQLLGRHAFNDERTKVDWVVGYGQSYRDLPDYRAFRRDILDDGERALFFFPRANPEFFGKFYSRMDERIVSANANLEQKLRLNFVEEGREPSVKAGFFSEFKSRDFSARNMGYTINQLAFNNELRFQTPGEVFADINNINNVDGLRLDEQTNPSDQYSATNQLLAGYAMLKLPLGQFEFTGGARVENNTYTLESAELTGTPVSVDVPRTSLLPSANLAYNFRSDMLVRAAYGRTVNRPEFRELAPFSFYDFEYSFTVLGNPNLLPATVDNLDVRWEWYPSPSETISFGGFYKRFDSPIETIFQDNGGSNRNFFFQNAESAYTAGLEIDVRKHLAGLTTSRFLSDITITGNASLITSEVELGAAASGQTNQRFLQGQSPYVVNTGIYYNNIASRWQVNLLFNVFGPRIFAVGSRDFPDTYEMPRNVLDLTFSKGLSDRLVIRGGITDMLNQENLLLRSFNDRLDRENDLPIQRFRPGRVFSLGATYDLYRDRR